MKKEFIIANISWNPTGWRNTYINLLFRILTPESAAVNPKDIESQKGALHLVGVVTNEITSSEYMPGGDNTTLRQVVPM